MDQMKIIQCFFQFLIRQIIDINCSNIVIGGDFNLVLNTELDKTGGTGRTHTRSSNYVKQIIQNHELLDIWRIQHPDAKQFTWRRRNPYPIQCRLDMFLISDTIQGCITSSTISSSFRSDHSLIGINCNFSDISRGPGYWKLNCSLLDDNFYVI